MVNRKVFCIIMIAVFSSLPLLSVVPVQAQEYLRHETLYLFIDGGRRDVPDNFNPYTPGWISSAGHQAFMEYLFYYNMENGTLMPWLAKGYELSSDFKTMTLYLREGVKWNDGEDFTAEDVAFTYNMLLEPHVPPLSYEVLVQDRIESVEVVDETTVVFHFKKPSPREPYSSMFSVMIWGGVYIVPEHVWKDVDPTTFRNPDNIWTGPYKLKEYSEIGDKYVYERDDNWWGTAELGITPARKYVVYVAYATEEATGLELSANRLDCGGYITPGTFASLTEVNPNVTAWYSEEPWAWAEPCPLYLPIITARYPWSMKEVRWALSYAIDRNALNVIGQEGTAPPFGNIFSPYMEPMYLEAVAEKEDEYKPLEYNPAKTEEIFTNLGFEKGADGIWVTPNGTRLEFKILTHSGWLFIRRYGENVADQLRAVGIDAYARLLTGTAHSEAWQFGDCDAWAGWFCTYPNEPYGALDWLHSKWVVPLGERSVGGNNVRWGNSTFDEIVDEMYPMDPHDPEYITLFKEALDIFYQELPIICTTHQPALIVYNDRYWKGWPTSEDPYIQPYFQCATFKFIIQNVESTYVEPEEPEAPPPAIPSWTYALAAITVIAVIVAAWALMRRK